MIIQYHPNPLKTKVLLNDTDILKLKYRIHIERLEERLGSIHLYLEKDNIDKVKKLADWNNFWGDTSPTPDEKWVNEMVDEYVEDLKLSHGGDCTCFPGACLKCCAEDYLEINTIPGLSKHAGYNIWLAYGEKGIEKSPQEALNYLKNYTSSTSNPELSERWGREAKEAYNWLKKYLEIHTF